MNDIDLLYSPQWFFGKDILIDIVSVIVLFLIGYFGIKYYKLNKKNKNYLVLASSFFMLAVSFLFKILTNFTIYYHTIETRTLGALTLTYHAVKSSNLFFIIGFLMYRILTLLGLYLLYSIYQKQTKPNIFLVVYLLLIVTYFSSSAFYIFHLTSFILLLFITSQYIKNYKNNKIETTRSLAYSFGIITISQVLFILVRFNLFLYVIGESLQLVGYIWLLFTFISVLKHGKKKR